jgi:hypothetical protein
VKKEETKKSDSMKEDTEKITSDEIELGYRESDEGVRYQL